MGVRGFKRAAAASGGGGGDFTLSVGATGNTTYVLDRVYNSGRYTLAFANSDTTYDIYAIAENGTYAGYTNGAVLDISANFAEIVVLGAASNETIIFSYEGSLTEPSTAGDVATAGAFVSGVATSSLPGINDTTVVNGGNFAANVVVSFIDQSDAETLAKNVVRSSSTQLVVTRPDAFSPDNSPYTVKVVNPGIPVPSGSNAYLLSNAVTAGTNPVWQTAGDLLYNIDAATPDITLLATDTEGTDIDYSVVSGTLPTGLALVEETGVISGTFSGSAAEGDSNSVTFRAVDAGGNFLDKAFNFVANAAPVWTTAANGLDDPGFNGIYSFQLVASGGSEGGALIYTLQAGALSTGLSISSSGLISGTNTDSDGVVATFTIRVADASGLHTDRQFSVTATPALYPFSSATFTPGGATGREGPNITQARSAVGQAWATNYLNMSTNGIQIWTIPEDGTYRITAVGAAGGEGLNNPKGNGASMRGDFTLTGGDTIKILVGQLGIGDASGVGGGGGGSFVVGSSNSVLVTAGGGGGGDQGSGSSAGGDGQTSSGGQSSRTDGAVSGGSSGYGGSAASTTEFSGSGGGGMIGSGASGHSSSSGGISFASGGIGGFGNSNGGFGGGGGSGLGTDNAGGGAGGYSGGGGGLSGGSAGGGGGGGSFNNGSNTASSSGVNSGDGSVVITLL